MSADIERHDFQPGPRADRCAECYCPPDHSIHGGRPVTRPAGPPYRNPYPADPSGMLGLPDGFHVAGEQPAASDGDGGRSYAAAVAHRAELDDGGDNVTDALAGDELMAWRMTLRTQQVILAALEVAARLPAQRAECERVAAIVRSAGGIHCPDCGPDRYGKHGIGHAFSETGGE